MNSVENEEKLKQQLNDLTDWLNKLLALSHEIMDSGITLQDNDHLGFMAMCFLAKQITHAASMIALLPSIDSSLIARAMYESLCQLIWAWQVPDRSQQWRFFAVVHDWRLLQEQKNSGTSIPIEQERLVDEGINKYSDLFLTKKAKNLRESGERTPDDPYHKTWTCSTTIKGMCDEIGCPNDYKKVYSSLSTWIHSDCVGISKVLSHDDKSFTFSNTSLLMARRSASIAASCLLQTLELVGEHLLSHDWQYRISEMRNSYTVWNNEIVE